jgi:beta-N-acetylhexosaminidase
MRFFRPAVIFLIAFFLSFSGCSPQSGAAGAGDSVVTAAESAIDAFAAERERAVRLAAALDDRLLAAQVIISGVDGRGALTRDMRTLLTECPAGGIILFRYNLDTETDAIQNLIAEGASLIASLTRNGDEGETVRPGIPPFVAADHEGGAVNRFNAGVAALPAALAYWELAQKKGREQAIAQVEADSFRAGAEIRALGINLNLAPVAEHLTGDNRDFLKDRSYGPDPSFAAEAAAAFIRGMGRAGLLCSVKHFPGSAGPDPHRFPSILTGDRAALDELAAPFISLVRGGQVQALVAAHTLVPAVDREHVASLSAPVLDGWLRFELGFTGLIISDDFSMAAGADMVLVWPPDVRRTHRTILAALDEGRLSRDRLREAAARIIFEKIRMGLINGN